MVMQFKFIISDERYLKIILRKFWFSEAVMNAFSFCVEEIIFKTENQIQNLMLADNSYNCQSRKHISFN